LEPEKQNWRGEANCRFLTPPFLRSAWPSELPVSDASEKRKQAPENRKQHGAKPRRQKPVVQLAAFDGERKASETGSLAIATKHTEIAKSLGFSYFRVFRSLVFQACA
jgi:hypothetical protein